MLKKIKIQITRASVYLPVLGSDSPPSSLSHVHTQHVRKRTQIPPRSAPPPSPLPPRPHSYLCLFPSSETSGNRTRCRQNGFAQIERRPSVHAFVRPVITPWGSVKISYDNRVTTALTGGSGECGNTPPPLPPAVPPPIPLETSPPPPPPTNARLLLLLLL